MSNVKMFSSLCPFLHMYHFTYKTIPISYFPKNTDLKNHKLISISPLFTFNKLPLVLKTSSTRKLTFVIAFI